MYKEFIPGGMAADFLEVVWLAEGGTERVILPDNCTDIIIPLGSGRSSQFIGPMTSYLIHTPIPDELLLGIRFKPGYSAAFVRDDLSVYADIRCELSALLPVPFSTIQDKFLNDGLLDFDTLSTIVSDLGSGFTPDPMVLNSIDMIRRAHGNIRIEELSEASGVSRRTLEKKFRIYLGKTPKRFVRIERFTAWLGGEGEAEYYDQSHLIKEFRTFTGTTPGRFGMRKEFRGN